MASLQHHAAAVLALGLLAGCGGDRSRTGAGADTTGSAAVVKPDSAAMPVTDTSVPARDSTRSAAPSTTADTGAGSTAAAPATKAPSTTPAAKAPAAPSSAARKEQMAAAGARTAHDTAASSGQAQQDTSGVQKAESTNSAAPAPAPAPQQQDTSKHTTGAAEQPLRDAYHQAPRDTVSQAVYDGWKQFNLNCARCHGEDVLGTTIAPHLIVSLKPDGPINTKELFVQTVCAGRPEKGMPSWCALGLDMNKINEIYEYVKGRSDAKISPGRPAVKEQG
jgi:cytochrome c